LEAYEFICVNILVKKQTGKPIMMQTYRLCLYYYKMYISNKGAFFGAAA